MAASATAPEAAGAARGAIRPTNCRRKLAETRPSEDAEPEGEPPAAPEPGIDERRRAVHERARSAIDDMRGTGSDPE